MQVLQSNPRRSLDLLTIGGGGRIAAACSTIGIPGHVDVWEVSSNEAIHRPLVSAREARSLAFTPDGRFLFVAETRNTVLFDLDAVLDPLTGPECALGYPMLALSADGLRLALTESHAQLSRLTFFSVGQSPIAQSPWSSDYTIFVKEPAFRSWFKFPTVNSNGTRVAVVNCGNVSRGEVIEISDPGRFEPVRIPSSALKPVQQLAFSADGLRLLVRTSGTAIRIFDAITGAALGELAHPGKADVTGMAVLSGSGLIATCRADGTVWFWHPKNRTDGSLTWLWDPATLQPVRTLDWKLGKLVSVAFSPDGTIGAAGTEDGQVVVWDVDE
jgi:WD40 repeat protein